MKLSQIRLDTISTISAVTPKGFRVKFRNIDASPILAWQLELVRQYKTKEKARSAGLLEIAILSPIQTA